MMNKDGNYQKAILKWEIWSFIFIILFGSLLHFIFDWFGRWKPLAFLAAVNESTWEHLKLAFWPAFIFPFFECKYLKNRINNLIIAKTLSIYTMIIMITVLFYFYLWIIGHDILFLDISIFIVSVGIGQVVSYKILIAHQLSRKVEITALIFLILSILTFLLFSYLPPHIFLFKDPITGSYGI